MKTAKRLLSLLLAMMMLTALVACAGGGGDNSDSIDVSGSEQTGDTWQPKQRPTDVTSGKTYIIIQHSGDDSPFSYSGDSAMAEQALARVEEVKELFSCEIEFEQVAYNDSFASAMQQKAAAKDAGENVGDLIFSNNNAKLRLALGTGGDDSLMVELTQMDAIINFWNTDLWGSISARECMMAGGQFYGVCPALWIGATPLPFYVIAYNREMLETFSATDPQEYWEREEWDQDAMLEVITSCYDNSGAETIWGMTADLTHMVRATFLATGVQMVTVDSSTEKGWTNGLLSNDAVAAFTWLKNALSANKQYFNNGESTWKTWQSQTPFIAEQCAMCVTRPATLLDTIMTSDLTSVGLITWAGSEANIQTGYYENTYSIAIPVFAQNAQVSAFLMYDLFQGLDGLETYDDVIAYYRENYFETDIDVEVLVRKDAVLQYSYWPNGLDSLWGTLANGLASSSPKTLLEKNASTNDALNEQYILPNKQALAQYKAEGKY